MKLINRLKSVIPVQQRLYLLKLFYQLSPFRFNYTLEPLNSLKSKINRYFSLFPSKRKAFIHEIEFINNCADGTNPFSYVFPYSFVFDYDYNQIKVYKDEKKGLFYVLHKGKRLYYSKDYLTEASVKLNYNSMSIEQDEKSPHRYLNDHFTVEENDVVIDIGAAQGNFSLDVIERTGTLYICETDVNWIEALNATFEPWKEKVHIINKFVSNVDNDKCATLDGLMGDNPVNFIKMDVEGAEMLILERSEKVFNNNPSLKLAICTYHGKKDANAIERKLSENKFNCSFSNGYVLFLNRILTPPYFRRGLIKAQKIRSDDFQGS